jgi:hypothetical protein
VSVEFEPGLRFRIERAGVAARELEVDAPRALLGSGAHCEVRLGTHEAAPEHLLVRCTTAGLEAVCCAAAAATLLDGAPFVRGLVADGARFTIGDCEVRVERTGTVPSSSTARARRSRRLVVAMLSLMSVAIVALLLLDRSGADSVARPPPTPPLWMPSQAQPCARAARVEARKLGEMHWQAALMKHERSPYHLEDAMQAVSLFQRAAACFEQSGDQTAAARAERKFERFLRELEADYHRRRILLERAVEQNDWRTAGWEANALWRMLGDRQGDYTRWLISVQRHAAGSAAHDEG